MAEPTAQGPDYREVLATIHQLLQPRTYVEIGVAQGASLALVGPGTAAIGVDPDPRLEVDLPANVRVFDQTSDAFFAEVDVRAQLGGLPVDLAFVDGLHHFEVALRDLANLERLAGPRSVLLLHDCYPIDRASARRTNDTFLWAGDVWKLVLLLRRHRPDLRLVTLDAWPTGLGVITGLNPDDRVLHDRYDDLVAEHRELDYAVLAADKEELLGVSPSDETTLRQLLEPVTPTRPTPTS